MPEDLIFFSTGCGRCGTGFMSRSLRSLGFDVGHEVMGKNGTSSWFAASHMPHNTPIPPLVSFNYNFGIHQVRNPITAHESILRFIVRHESFTWVKAVIRKELSVELNHLRNEHELAFAYWLYWNELVEKNIRTVFHFRVEEGQHALESELRQHGIECDKVRYEVSKKYNTGFRNGAEENAGSPLTERVRDDATDSRAINPELVFRNRVQPGLRFAVIEKAHSYGYNLFPG